MAKDESAQERSRLTIEDKVNLWVSMGYRYLESGRPKKVRALVESILEINPHSERAERLKRLARERYGDIE